MSADNGTVVVVEDDPHIADLVDLYLRREGFRVLLAGDGEKGLELFNQEDPWIVILDVGLPGPRDGFEVCREIRARSSCPSSSSRRVTTRWTASSGWSWAPTTTWSSRSRPGSWWPGSAPSCAGRGKARRPRTSSTVGDLEVDLRRREARRAGEVVALTTREFDLLAFLASNIGLALSRQQLLDGVWGADWYGDERTVDVHVAQLRKKLGSDLPLATVWGVGYRFG